MEPPGTARKPALYVFGIEREVEDECTRATARPGAKLREGLDEGEIEQAIDLAKFQNQICNLQFEICNSVSGSGKSYRPHPPDAE
jgi:hypothetical protein